MFDATKVKASQWVLVLIFVVAVFAALAVLMSDTERQEAAEMNPPQIMENETGTAPKSGTAAQTKLYNQLVTQYEGERVQFDINCQANPSNLVLKSGTKVMFDNRSGDARMITIGGVQYSFAGYGYKILTLSSNSLPKTLLLSCGSAVNVGQILLQK